MSGQAAGHIAQIRSDAALFERAARAAGLDASVPGTRWDVRRLVQHTTKVHHWVASILAGAQPADFAFERPEDDQLLAVFAGGVQAVTAALESTPPARPVWTMRPAASGVEFWGRRQAHELSIHRVDAERAAQNGVSEIDASFAADGLAELLLETLPGPRYAEAVTRPFTVTVTPLDANAGWTVAATPAGVTCVPESRDGSDLVVFGMASELYRWAWNRLGDDEVSLRGDLTLADTWREVFTVGAR